MAFWIGVVEPRLTWMDMIGNELGPLIFIKPVTVSVRHIGTAKRIWDPGRTFRRGPTNVS
jgi:hypothetical protein